MAVCVLREYEYLSVNQVVTDMDSGRKPYIDYMSVNHNAYKASRGKGVKGIDGNSKSRQ